MAEIGGDPQLWDPDFATGFSAEFLQMPVLNQILSPFGTATRAVLRLQASGCKVPLILAWWQSFMMKDPQKSVSVQ